MDEKRLKHLEELSKLDQELGLPIWNENLTVDGFVLVCTSMACPEQYDVFDPDGLKVGYLRLRHGVFRADYPDCGGETVYRSHTIGDGAFDERERTAELGKAVEAIKNRLSKTG